MGLTARATGGGSFKPLPPGMHLARCYRIIDLGTQKVEWKGAVKLQPKVLVQWEVHGDDEEGKPLLTDKGDPLSISKTYTLSLGDNSRLRADLKSWRGRDFTAEEMAGFHLRNILDKWCMLTVTHTAGDDGKTFANVSSVNPVPGQTRRAGLPDGINEARFFDLDNPDMALFDTFGDKLRAKIQAAPEWPKPRSPAERYQQEQNQSAQSLADMDDDIPF